MSKIGAVSMMLAIALTLMTVCLIFLVSAVDNKQYILGERIKIEIGEIGEYTLSIKSPNKTMLYKSEKPHFIFEPKIPGEYVIKIKSQSESRQMLFKVVPKPRLQDKEGMIHIPIEKVRYEQQPQEIENETDDKTASKKSKNESQVTVGKPVVWKKNIQPGKNIQIKIPEVSTNISVSLNEASFKIKKSIADSLSNIVSEERQKSIIIQETEDELEITYQTPAPVKKEKIISKEKKEVEISSSLHYENVLAFTNLTEELPVEKINLINVYWKEEDKFLPFTATDTNNNTLLDYLEWTVPHLSTQTFEIIIITRAEHLDENRQVLEDIFDKVSQKDNIWQAIPKNNYIRVVFEKFLTQENDITLYAKSNSSNATVEVYEKDSSSKIATFPLIQKENFYRILLTNLPSPQDTFDLLVKGATIFFDLIIDPPQDGGYMVFQDTFTGAGSLFSHTPDLGVDWTEIYSDASDLTITANQLDGDNAGNDGSAGYAGISGTWKDDQMAKVTYSAQDNGDDHIHLLLRADATWSNAYTFSFSVSATDTYIWKRVANSNTVIQSSCGGNNQFTTGNEVSFKIVGEQLEVFDGNTLVCSATDSDISSGRAGVGVGSSPIDTGGDQSNQRADNLEIYLFNRMPLTTSPQINSTDGTNWATQDLNCMATLTDNDNEPSNATVRWYKDNALILTHNLGNNYPNASTFTSTLSSGNTTVGEIWKCSVQSNDALNSSAWANSSNLEVAVANYAPKAIPEIITSTGNNYTNADIDCSSTLTDADSTLINASIKWYQDGTLNKTTLFSNQPNNTFISSVIPSSSTSISGIWVCSIDADDGIRSIQENMTIVILDYPINYNMKLVVNDTFTGAGSLYSHTPDLGLSWTEIYNDASNLIITANELDGDNAGNDGSTGYANIVGTWTDDQLVQITYSAQDTDDDHIHLTLRADATWTNAYTFSFSTFAIDTYIWKRVGGAVSYLNQSCGLDNQFTVGDTVSMKVTGNLIEVFDGSTLVCSATDSDISSGRAGIGIGSSPRDTGGDQSSQRADDLLIYISNTPTVTSIPQLVSQSGFNLTSEDLNCSVTLIDQDIEPINATVKWYKNDVLNSTIFYNDNYPNATLLSSILSNTITHPSETWKCSARATDGISYSSWTNSSALTIQDPGNPPQITINSPTQQSYLTSSIDLNISIDKTASWCGYSLDGEANISITKINNTFFSDKKVFSGGEHNLEIYCNDTFGVYNSTNTTFLVSITQYETIGEWGVETDIPPAVWNTVYFQNSFSEIPIVVHQIDYNYDYTDNPCTTRVRAITKDSFQIRTDSWSESASCPATGIDGYWLAMEKGVHNVSNAGVPVREVEATNFTMDVGSCGSGANPSDWTHSANQRQFQNTWSAQPLVLSAVQTANDVDPISQYMHGCTASASTTWNESCIEIGLNGMENDGAIQPCNLHTQNEEGGYIAWEMDSSWSNAESRDNTGTSGDGVTGYSWEAYWESDNVQGSDNDPWPMSAWYITLSQSYDEGIALGSGIRIDGNNGVFPTVHYGAPDNQVFLLSDEDMFGDSEQNHIAEPYELLFFTSNTGFLFSEKILNMLTVTSPINDTIYGTSSIIFEVSSLIDSDSCWFSLDGAANQTMSKADSKNFDYVQNSLSSTAHNATFYCNDTYSGEYSSDLYIFEVDASPLTLTATSPTPQTYATSSINFSVNTSKPVDTCTYSLDGATGIAMTQINSTHYETTKSYMREGDHDVNFTCTLSGSANSTLIAFSIDLGITENISRGSVTLPSGSTEVNATFSAQDLSKTYLTLSTRSASSGPSQIQVLGELMENKINFRRYSTTGDVYIEWEIVESPDLYVQRASSSHTSGQAADASTINQVNLSESFTTISSRLSSGTTSENTQGFWAAKFDSTSQLSVSRGATGAAGEFHWQAIEWDGSRVQSGYISGTGTNPTQSLTNTVNTTRSFLTFSRQIASQISIQENFIRGYITDQDNIGFAKVSGSAVHDISWYLVENDRFTVQSGQTTVTGSSPVTASINQVELNSSFSSSTYTSTGTGTTYANGFLSHEISDTTNIAFQKGTASNTGVSNWFVIALGIAPVDFMTIISPKPQTYSTTTIDFNISLSEAGSWCAYSLDEAANQTLGKLNSTYFYFSQAGLSSTTHNVTFYCNNTLGEMSKSSMIFFDIDMSAPTVTSIGPANQTTNTTNTTNTLYFSYNATDNAAVDSCSLIANEQVVWIDTSVTMDTTQIFTPYLDNGIYTWYINCSDDGGLVGSSEKRIINVSGPEIYTWTNRFYETSTSDFTSQADIGLAASRDATENNVAITLPASSLTTVTVAKSSYLGNGGAIIPSSTIIDFSGYATAARNNFAYLTWKVYVENSSGDFLICQSGDDSTTGTRMSSPAATWVGACNSPAYDLILKKSDRIKMVLNAYNSDSSSLDFTHSWDDLKLSFVGFMTFTSLGALQVDLSFPVSNISINNQQSTNVTCQASCTTGSCPSTNIYIQRHNGTDWINIGSTGSLILNTGEINPHSLGSVSSLSSTNFTLKGNAASLNDIRCIGTSIYSSAIGTTIREVEIQDSNLAPEVFLSSPLTSTFFNTSQIVLFYNASDENNNIANTTLILSGEPNMTNASIILNNQINNFTIILPDGYYNWTVNATDSQGETAVDATVRNFIIDTGIPRVFLHNPLLGENIDSAKVFFNFTTTDNMDSNLSCNLTVDGIVIEPGLSAINASYVNLTKTLSLGAHYWNVSCQDDAGNLNFSETRDFDVSDTPPMVEFMTPDFTWFDFPNLDLQYNVTDNSQILNCSLFINGVFNQTNSSEIALGEINEFNLVGFPDNQYNWSVSCQDDASLITSTLNQTFYVDTSAPQINLNLPSHLTISPISDTNFNFTATDNLGPTLTCNLTINNQILSQDIDATSAMLENELISGLQDGAQSWNVTCVDIAGNTNTSTTRTITIEEYPTLALDTPDNSWFQADLDLYYTPADNTNLSECTLIINDAANRTNATPVTNGVQNLFSVDNFADGEYNWSVNCTDTYGLTTAAGETRTVYRDSVSPQIELLNPIDGENVFSGNINFNFTTTDSLAENLTCNITVDGNNVDTNFNATSGSQINRTNAVAPGQHFWNTTCWDIAGNTNTSATWNFTNFEAPSVTLDSPENETWLNNTTQTLFYNIIDSDDNIENCSLYIDGTFDQGNQTLVDNGVINNFTTSFLEGAHTWNVICTDQTSLQGTGMTRTLYIDTESPKTTLLSPLPSETLDWNNVTFNFTSQDNLDDTLNCSLIIDSFPEITNIPITNNTNYTEYVMRNDGTYLWQVECIDQAGNTNLTGTRSFTVDAPPKVTLLDPANNNITTLSAITFEYLPEDASGLIQCDMYFDGEINDTDNSVEKNQPNFFTITGISEGRHNWTVECLDADSNIYAPIPFNITRDITPPSITLSSPNNNSGLDANNNVVFQWTPTDSLDLLLTCDLIIDGNIEDTSFATSGFLRTEPVSGLSLGQHIWNVTCMDQSGNSNTSKTRQFNYTYPDFMINETSISISNDNPTENESIQINATVYNLGGADMSSVNVKFYNEDPETTGVQIGTTQIISIDKFSSNTTSIQWDAPLGNTNIFTIVDFPDTTTELNETNNKANTSISVESWHFFYGNINPDTNFTLTDSSSYELTNWNLQNLTRANIYVADYDSNINWLSLQAIGKTPAGAPSTNDIQEIDSSLFMTAFKDSHVALYLNSSSEINETLDYTVFAKQITQVPVATSINSSNFKTGILWDTSDDSNSEFETTEKEDIVYVTSVQKSTLGSYEVADYELRVPAKLREYDMANQQTAVFYIEII